MLAVCDNMKIVEVPEEGRRCFILKETGGVHGGSESRESEAEGIESVKCE